MRIENQRGLVLTEGTAYVLLPSREHGAVRLPKPANEDVLALLRHEVATLREKNER